MGSSTVPILVLFCFLLRFGLTGGAISERDETQALTEEEKKVLSECEHPDYRTYIKCLKRHKRQHNAPGSKVCLEECFEGDCTTPRCADDCYVKCKRKVRLEETYNRVVEAECNNDKCNDRPTVHNVATTVNVNNSLLGENATAFLRELRPKIEINNVINNDGNRNTGASGSGTPNVFTFSMSMAGYGPLPIFIPPMTPLVNPSSNINCSFCGTLIFKYMCDMSCSNVTATQSPKTDRPLIDPGRCRSPSCVGGT